MGNIEIYQAPAVQNIIQHYGNLLVPTAGTTIKTHLESLSLKMLEGLVAHKECIFQEINNYHPSHLGTPINQLKKRSWDLSDSNHAIANEFGFTSWEEVLELETTEYNMPFENCVQAILKGDLLKMVKILDEFPQLVNSFSQYGHRASLLHYCASNGIELWRQQVPSNINKVVYLLKERGASIDVKMDVYGGKFTPFELASTSAHPSSAGVKYQLEQALKK